MYEAQIADAAARLSVRRGQTAMKMDRTFTERISEIVSRLEVMGFCSWQTGVVGDKYQDPAAQLDGVEASSGDEVKLRLYNCDNRLVPKHLSFSLVRQRNGRGVVIGVHVGTLRFTDLRTKQSYYDGALWGLSHFRIQLAVEQFRAQLKIPAELVEKHLAGAAAQLVELGITETRHCILPQSGCMDVYRIVMVPYLVGKYGDMPVAVRLMYTKSDCITLQFYIMDAIGTVNINFGYMVLGRNGEQVNSQMDIGSLLAGPTRK
jgi:hypothetical protein